MRAPRCSPIEALRGRAFGAALSDAVDAALVEAFARDVDEPGEVALVALGFVRLGASCARVPTSTCCWCTTCAVAAAPTRCGR